MNGLEQIASSTGNFLNQIAEWFQDNTVDIMYKLFAVIAVLVAMWFIPQTKKFAGWTALILLFLILIASSPQNATSQPANSTLPLPTQIGTPVPPQGSSGNSSSSSGTSSGGGIGSYISDALAFLPFFL